MKSELVFLEDILESIELIEDYISGVSEDDFYRSTQLQDAVIRRIEIIGEAAKKITESTRVKYPEMPWRMLDQKSGRCLGYRFTSACRG